MLTITDCLGVANLPADEVEAVAEHEHVPFIVALEEEVALLGRSDGCARIGRMIEEDMEAAERHHDAARLARWRAVLERFRRDHAAELAGAPGRAAG